MSLAHDLPIEALQHTNMAALSPEDRSVAKARLHAHNELRFHEEGAEWQKRQQPANMVNPFCATITGGVEAPKVGALTIMSDRIPGARRLEPGEVVAVDAEWEEIKIALARKLLELTMEPITRPLVYESKSLAAVTRPPAWERVLREDPARAKDVKKATTKHIRLLNEQMAECRKKKGSTSRLDLAETAAKIAAQVAEEDAEVLTGEDPRAAGVDPSALKTSRRASRG